MRIAMGEPGRLYRTGSMRNGLMRWREGYEKPNMASAEEQLAAFCRRPRLTTGANVCAALCERRTVRCLPFDVGSIVGRFSVRYKYCGRRSRQYAPWARRVTLKTVFVDGLCGGAET